MRRRRVEDGSERGRRSRGVGQVDPGPELEIRMEDCSSQLADCAFA